MFETLPCKEICSVGKGEWCIGFDSSSTHRRGGVGVMLYTPNGTNVSLSFKLKFFCSNNKAEYEDLTIGLIFALQIGTRFVCKEIPVASLSKSTENQLSKRLLS